MTTNEQRSRFALIGFKGAGKTTMGNQLAEKLKIPFFDTDRLIKQRHPLLTCAEIYHTLGESYFRMLEREVIASLKDYPPCVIATGGGTLCDAINAERLKRYSMLIYLKTPLEVIRERIWSQEELPVYLAEAADPHHAFEAMYQERTLVYEAWADYVIEISSLELDIKSPLECLYERVRDLA